LKLETKQVRGNEMNKMNAWCLAHYTRVLTALREERGDVPGWVLVTVMTAGLVVAIWSVADGQLKTVLSNALRSVSQP
jgi:hypothetical protein